MSLSDVMAGAGLARYAEVALILFFGCFVAIAARALWPSAKRRAEMREAARLPLDDEPAGAGPRPGATP